MDANAVSQSVSDTPNGRFPKSAHLLRHSDFVRVYQQGRRHFSGNMTVFYLQSQGEQAERASSGNGVRVGFTVPKALGGAVARNRMRRRTREAVRHHLALFESMDAGIDVVINPKKSLLTAEFAQISQEVERAFAVIRRACGKSKSGAVETKYGGAAGTKPSGGAQPRRSEAKPKARTAAQSRAHARPEASQQ